jgi:hypothetical protein
LILPAVHTWQGGPFSFHHVEDRSVDPCDVTGRGPSRGRGHADTVLSAARTPLFGLALRLIALLDMRLDALDELVFGHAYSFCPGLTRRGFSLIGMIVAPERSACSRRFPASEQFCFSQAAG